MAYKGEPTAEELALLKWDIDEQEREEIDTFVDSALKHYREFERRGGTATQEYVREVAEKLEGRSHAALIIEDQNYDRPLRDEAS